jgi:heme-degrading monooxygenase HmoA
MFARLTFISLQSESIEEVKKIYNEEIVPVVRSQQGNVGAWLLEPNNDTDDFISLTEWLSEADANVYESSGTYRTLVDKLKDKYKSKPVLKTYNVAETKVTAAI